MTSGRLLVISGPSGAGKTTVVQNFLAERPPNVELSVSATTRESRPGERDGVDYHFLSREEFERRIEEGRFLEHAEVYENLYGTLREPVERALSEGRTLILEIDVQGAESVRRTGLPAVSVFVAPPSLEDLERRLEKRGTPPELREKRLRAAEAEMAKASQYDATVVNDTVEGAVSQLKEALQRFGILRPSAPSILSGNTMEKETMDQLIEKVGGKANLVLILQKRVHELVLGDSPKVENPPEDLVEAALREVVEEKISLEPPPPPPPPPKPRPKRFEGEGRPPRGRRDRPPRGPRGDRRGGRGGRGGDRRGPRDRGERRWRDRR